MMHTWRKTGDVVFLSLKVILVKTKEKKVGSSGIWTRDLLHPKQESYP